VVARKKSQAQEPSYHRSRFPDGTDRCAGMAPGGTPTHFVGESVGKKNRKATRIQNVESWIFLVSVSPAIPREMISGRHGILGAGDSWASANKGVCEGKVRRSEAGTGGVDR